MKYTKHAQDDRLLAFLFAAILIAMATFLYDCAAVAPSCKVIELGAEACEILVPVAGPDGKVTYVHVPASDVRAHAGAILRGAAPSSSASVVPSASVSAPAPSSSHP